MSDISRWPEDGPPESERLQQLGWDQARDEEFAQLGEPGSVPGRIARVDRGSRGQPGGELHRERHGGGRLAGDR